MVRFPNIKINLGLYITEKRQDGFHNLESVFYPVNFCDGLEIIKANQFSFEMEGLKIEGNPADNLCVKAYNILKADFDLAPVKMFLLKKIPTGSGLGGGSANGAFALKMLNELFELNLSQTQLENYAAKLGSDCPFFIANTPVFVEGRGEILSPISLSLKGHYITVVCSGIHISTKESFANITPAKPSINLKEEIQKPIEQWQQNITNDFEKYAFAQYPALQSIKQKLMDVGCIYAAMSGSGSAVYGISKEGISVNDFPKEYVGWGGECL
ncbi:MAG: 4-(cytidine 5'-diphospho)-2-C-methyl-D-erythritol kinase [Bacteroidetes bacterium]|nr:4-(cytidine 5'-diphospho)-2-C-methyl-D-erythritol kinase [Bacteroidota bacterium]